MIALAARNVRHRFNGVVALDDVSIEVPAGHAVALVGQSGSGKTTLMRCFNRMVEADAGQVLVGTQDVRQQDPIALRRRLGYVPQHGGLLPHWTVAQNVGLVLRARGQPNERAVADALALVGLTAETFGRRFPRELSGGQQQRVALARAIAAGSEAILLDEPFGALDAITRGEIQDAFAAVRERLAITTLLVTHDLAEAARLADTIVVMRAGRIEQTGPMAELVDAPRTDYVRALVHRARNQFEVLAGR